MMRMLLRAGIAAPVLYFATLIVASLTWPGYSHVTQYVSELGSAAAPHPGLFNAGIVATGLAGLLGGLGVGFHFAGAGRRWSGAFAGLALGAWGAGMIFGGAFPMPDPRHNGYGLVMGIVLLPPALALAMRGRARRHFRLFLLVWFLATLTLLAVLFGVGGLVTRANLGLWQRGLALAMIPGIGVACAALLRRQA
jgi:hypothetical membrane protein